MLSVFVKFYGYRFFFLWEVIWVIFSFISINCLALLYNHKSDSLSLCIPTNTPKSFYCDRGVNMLFSLIGSFNTWSVMRCVCKSLSCTCPRGRGGPPVGISRPSVSVPLGRPVTNGRQRESWLKRTASRCLT